jgi:hypothetical protein
MSVWDTYCGGMIRIKTMPTPRKTIALARIRKDLRFNIPR